MFQACFFITQLDQLLFNLDAFQAGQLPQADFQDVFSLPVGQIEPRDQCNFWVIGFTDDADDFVNIEEDNVPPFQNVNTIIYFAEAVTGARGALATAECSLNLPGWCASAAGS